MEISDTPGCPDTYPPKQMQTKKYGILSRMCISAVGVDKTILATQCREQDVIIIKAQGALFIASLALTTSTLMLVSHKILSEPGHIRPSLLMGSVAVGGLIGLADRYSFFLGSWFETGVQQLREYGGLGVSEGSNRHLQAGLKLTFRAALSIPLGLLSGAFLGTIVFYSDIKGVEEQRYLKVNDALFLQATAAADEKDAQLFQAVTLKHGEAKALSDQVTSLRRSVTDGVGTIEDPTAAQELNSLLRLKAASEEDVRKSESVEALELGGVSGPRTSGQAGNGPRHRAAMQEVANAKAHTERIGAAVDAARTRLDARREKLTSSTESTRLRLEQDLPMYEEKLRQATTDEEVLRKQLDNSRENRNAMIRSAVDTAPSRVTYNDGILAQLSALKELGQHDDQTAWIVWLFEIGTVALELAAICSKSLVKIPTDYAKFVARDAILNSVKIVDEIFAEMNSGSKIEAGSVKIPPWGKPANDNGKTNRAIVDVFSTADAGSTLDDPPQPPKRKRGRPKKNLLH